jgi:Fibronectin type III domain.
LTATAGDGSVALNWSASATATNYFIKRSTSSGSGYTSIATNASLSFTNNGLVNGLAYFYVVSALNAFGESTNSAQVGARPTSSTPTQLGFAALVNQLQLTGRWITRAGSCNRRRMASARTGLTSPVRRRPTRSRCR